jgi:hypothetical protein
MRVFPSSRGASCAGALCLLVAIAFGAPEARAGCGVGHERPVVGLDRLHISPVSPGVPAEEPGVPGPCPGGLCRPEQPKPVVPSAPPSLRVEQWPALVIARLWPDSESGFSLPVEPPSYADPSLPSLERPPRSGDRSAR